MYSGSSLLGSKFLTGPEAVKAFSDSSAVDSDIHEDHSLPTLADVEQIFNDMLKGSGVPYTNLLHIIGGCRMCDKVMALTNIFKHECLGRSNPPAHPLASGSASTKSQEHLNIAVASPSTVIRGTHTNLALKAQC